jgi:microcystin-dependent protein
MALPFVGEIRMFGGNFAPLGWALCDGQLLPIAENEVLFQLIGTTYGGDGQETFALPDLRGRIPIHQGNGRIIGELDGSETVTLTANQLPTHTHPLLASTTLASDPNPQGRVLAQTRAAALYLDDAPTVPLSPNAATPQGGSQPHDNMMPFVGINFIISLFGIFPSPT